MTECSKNESNITALCQALFCSVSSEFNIQPDHASADVCSAAGGISQYLLLLSYLHALRTGKGFGSSSNMQPDLYHACVNIL